MTPRQLHALRERRLAHLQREELLVGIVASTTANFGFCRPEKPISAESFMLHPFDKPPDQGMDGESLMAVLHAVPGIKIERTS